MESSPRLHGPSAAAVEVLWRPGCGYCARLRRGLRRAGLPTVERDIWADPSAAAQLREVTGGDEIVPTVLVGSQALVNPSVADVLEAVRVECPDVAAEVARSGPADTGFTGGRPAADWTLAVALLWVLLAAWRPTTTWHLGALLVAAVAPWLIGQDVRVRDRRALPRLAVAAGAGLLVAATVTAALEAGGSLRGVTVLGFPTPWTEALAAAGVGAVLGAAPGAMRALRPPPPVRSAWLGNRLLARSDDVVMVEGNAYFPLSAVAPGVLAPTSTRSVCPWKGVAGYYSVTLDGVEHADTAWTYRRPWPLARRVKDRVAFWGDVEIRTDT